MQRPIGVTLLAIGSALVGVLEVWRALVFMGWVSWTFVGREVQFDDPQWGQVIWALILAAIWFWVAAGFWNVRAYAWSHPNPLPIARRHCRPKARLRFPPSRRSPSCRSRT